MLQEPFFDLPIELPDQLDGFILDTRSLESRIMAFNGGIDLASNKRYPLSPDLQKRFDELVPYCFSDEEQLGSVEDKAPPKTILEYLAPFSDRAGPSSMLVESRSELAEHISKLYQVANIHYIKAKQTNKSGFPWKSCGNSSRSLAVAYFKHGYHNAAVASAIAELDHAYVVLPFKMRKEPFEGVIIVDPTSDQMLPANRQIRNAIYIKSGIEWEYSPRLNRKENHYPAKILDKDIFKKADGAMFGRRVSFAGSYTDAEQYFKDAFSNAKKIGPQNPPRFMEFFQGFLGYFQRSKNRN